jgi:hypothetical protein
MGESVDLVDTIVLIAGLVLILFTSLRVSQRRTREKPAKGQTAAVIGIAIWLGCLAVALYMIFG